MSTEYSPTTGSPRCLDALAKPVADFLFTEKKIGLPSPLNSFPLA